MPPITKTNDELIKEAIEEASKKTADTIYEKLKSESGSGSKITQILNKAKGQPDVVEDNKKKAEIEEELQKEKEKLEQIKKKEREEFDKEKERLSKELEESEVYCPTCSPHKHEHKLKKTDKGTLKCTGDGCNTEYALISTKPDYYCEECHAPHLKPSTEEDVAKDSCPLCGGNKFMKSGGRGAVIDYNKIREKIEKKKK